MALETITTVERLCGSIRWQKWSHWLLSSFGFKQRTLNELFYAIYRLRKYIPLTFIFRSPSAFFAHPALSFTWKTWSDSCHLSFSKQNWNILNPLCWFKGKLLLQWQRTDSFPFSSCTLFLAVSHADWRGGTALVHGVIHVRCAKKRCAARHLNYYRSLWSDLSFI